MNQGTVRLKGRLLPWRVLLKKQKSRIFLQYPGKGSQQTNGSGPFSLESHHPRVLRGHRPLSGLRKYHYHRQL